MATKHPVSLTLALSAAAVLALAGGCKKEEGGHSPDDGHGHSHDAKPAATTPAGGGTAGTGDHPNRVVLGDVFVGGLTLKAFQDEPVKPGGEGAFDLQITGDPAGGKPKAVRCWVGTESGEGSVKAKADEETPGSWHAHVEVPSPLPPGAKFWSEVEPATGDPFKVSFDLKR